MPRRNLPARASAHRAARLPAVGGPGWARAENGPDGEWLVRAVPGEQALKSYRCPGCDHEISPGIAHIVAWPAHEHGSSADRRHWHTGCWNARARRAPTRRRW
ncbi:MAG TPA: hypothetical protein VFO16_24410 [Pseudonocardiaceae bacterium]|nr:hypothetical protein [Pseudonocardiaceae bacterium]